MDLIISKRVKVLICIIIYFYWYNFSTRVQSNLKGNNINQRELTKLPINAFKLIQSYPEKIIGYSNNRIYFSDSSFLIYDDSVRIKNESELLNSPDIEDQFKHKYIKISNLIKHPHLTDAGRIRNESLFKKIYGSTKNEVEKNLVEINWCPKLVGQKIRVTRINGIDKLLEKISTELDKHPKLQHYLKNIEGTFNWRKINGTDRISMHSFGMTIDINIAFSDYWQWSCRCSDESISLTYKNRIPKIIVEIFERYGFIWGGAWHHYDTMHFEYRPELLIE